MNEPSRRFTLMKILVLVSATAFGLSKYELKKKRSVQRQVLFPLAITLTPLYIHHLPQKHHHPLKAIFLSYGLASEAR